MKHAQNTQITEKTVCKAQYVPGQSKILSLVELVEVLAGENKKAHPFDLIRTPGGAGGVGGGTFRRKVDAEWIELIGMLKETARAALIEYRKTQKTEEVKVEEPKEPPAPTAGDIPVEVEEPVVVETPVVQEPPPLPTSVAATLAWDRVVSAVRNAFGRKEEVCTAGAA